MSLNAGYAYARIGRNERRCTINVKLFCCTTRYRARQDAICIPLPCVAVFHRFGSRLGELNRNEWCSVHGVNRVYSLGPIKVRFCYVYGVFKSALGRSQRISERLRIRSCRRTSKSRLLELSAVPVRVRNLMITEKYGRICLQWYA